MALTLAETQALQTELTEHIRDPASSPAPAGLEDRRLKIYRDLFYNNIEGFMARGFPILRSLLSDDHWHAMIRDFMRRHPAKTPLFPEITEEFVAYLQGDRLADQREPAFMLELAHYEWVEIAVDLADVDIDEIAHDRSGNLLDHKPVVSPLATSLAYNYPVHRIGPTWQPDGHPEEPTFLIVYRNRQDEVRFMEANGVTHRLLALIEDPEIDTGRAAMLKLAEEMQHPEPSQLLASGQITLDKLRRLDIILGVAG